MRSAPQKQVPLSPLLAGEGNGEEDGTENRYKWEGNGEEDGKGTDINCR